MYKNLVVFDLVQQGLVKICPYCMSYAWRSDCLVWSAKTFHWKDNSSITQSLQNAH